MDPFEKLRAGEPGGLDRPVAAPVVAKSGIAELDRLADATDRVIAELDRIVTRMERSYGR